VRYLAVNNIKELIDGLLQMGAGVSETYHDQVTDVVVDYRKGALYKKAEQEQKAVGSSDWIRKIIQEKTWFDPKFNLIYYPIPQHRIPAMENAIVTISGYTGD
jgi:hypothetical protein